MTRARHTEQRQSNGETTMTAPTELADFGNTTASVAGFVKQTLPVPAKPISPEDVVKVGRLLMQARAILRGDFEKWVVEQCPFSVRTARNYISAAQEAEVEVYTQAVRRFTPSGASTTLRIRILAVCPAPETTLCVVLGESAVRLVVDAPPFEIGRALVVLHAGGNIGVREKEGRCKRPPCFSSLLGDIDCASTRLRLALGSEPNECDSACNFSALQCCKGGARHLRQRGASG